MSGPFDYVKSIYSKDKRFTQDIEQWTNIYLNKVLVQDKDCADALKQIIEYCFYIDPTHYYYLLHFFIPKKFNYNLVKAPKELEVDEDPLLVKLKHILNWSNRELKINMNAVNKEILSNREYWEKEFAIDTKKKKKK